MFKSSPGRLREILLGLVLFYESDAECVDEMFGQARTRFFMVAGPARESGFYPIT